MRLTMPAWAYMRCRGRRLDTIDLLHLATFRLNRWRLARAEPLAAMNIGPSRPVPKFQLRSAYDHSRFRAFTNKLVSTVGLCLARCLDFASGVTRRARRRSRQTPENRRCTVKFAAALVGHRRPPRGIERALTDAVQRPIDITEKPTGKPGSLLLVPTRGVLEIGLSERPNDEPAGHSDSGTAIELLAETFLNSLPAVTSLWVGLEVFQALVKDFTVPIRNRNRLRSCSDSVPQRLQVVDLLVD